MKHLEWIWGEEVVLSKVLEENWGEMGEDGGNMGENGGELHKPCHLGGPQCGNKVRNGFISPAVSGAHMWAKWLHNPCHLRNPSKGGGVQMAAKPVPSWRP